MSFPKPIDLITGIDALAKCVTAEAALREAASDEQQRGDTKVMRAAHDQAIANVVLAARALLSVSDTGDGE
jgi:hypothetical protein